MSDIHNKMTAVGRVETRPEVVSMDRNGIRVMHSLCILQGTVGMDALSGWVRAVSSGKLAETILAGVRPGDCVAVEGVLRQQGWVDSKGAWRSARELHVERLEILGPVACERKDSSRAGSYGTQGEQQMFFNQRNSNGIMNNAPTYFENILNSTDRLDVWVSEHGHANIDSLPLRYGIRFERDTVLHLENVRDLGADEKHHDRHHVEAHFRNDEGERLFGHFVMRQSRPGQHPAVVTVWRNDVNTEFGLSELMRSLRENHKFTSADWIELHPAYVSGELRTTADLIDLLAERKAEQRAGAHGISLRTLEEEKAKAERKARELLASYEKVMRRAEHHRDVALEAIGHVERLSGENSALERKKAAAEAARERAEAERQVSDLIRKQAEIAKEQEELERRIAEADRQRAEAARQRAVAEKAQAEAAKKQAQDERVRAEVARQDAEEARRRTALERDEAEAARQREAADRYDAEVELVRLREENARLQETERRSAQRQGQQVAMSVPDTLVDVRERQMHRGSSCTILVLADGKRWYMKTSTFDPDGAVTRKARLLIGRRVRVTSWDPVREPGKWSSQGYFRNIYEAA